MCTGITVSAAEDAFRLSMSSEDAATVDPGACLGFAGLEGALLHVCELEKALYCKQVNYRRL